MVSPDPADVAGDEVGRIWITAASFGWSGLKYIDRCSRPEGTCAGIFTRRDRAGAEQRRYFLGFEFLPKVPKKIPGHRQHRVLFGLKDGDGFDHAAAGAREVAGCLQHASNVDEAGRRIDRVTGLPVHAQALVEDPEAALYVAAPEELVGKGSDLVHSIGAFGVTGRARDDRVKRGVGIVSAV